MTGKENQGNLHIISLCFCGVVAYILTNLSHEALGHGLTSLLLGNRITLLNSAYFRSTPHSFITDAFGPLMNLISGLIFFVILKRTSSRSLYIKLILLLIVAFNLFAFSWLCLYAGVTNIGDLAFDVSPLMSAFTWRAILVVTGLVMYYFSFILVLQSAREIFSNNEQSYSQKFVNQLFRTPYLAGGIAAWVAISFYTPFSYTNYYETFVFPMYLPILFVPGLLKTENPSDDTLGSSRSFQITLITAGLGLFIAFCLTIGRGMHF